MYEQTPDLDRLIWIDGDDFSGWCCSHCTWGMTAPRLESTVAALTFNRVAQEDFENHNCPTILQTDVRSPAPRPA